MLQEVLQCQRWHITLHSNKHKTFSYYSNKKSERINFPITSSFILQKVENNNSKYLKNFLVWLIMHCDIKIRILWSPNFPHLTTMFKELINKYLWVKYCPFLVTPVKHWYLNFYFKNLKIYKIILEGLQDEDHNQQL